MKIEGGLRCRGIFKDSQKGPLFSIITIVYNGENTIERTIKSVINQTYQNIEYIVIDGNSNDNTIKILEKYNDNIDYWLSEDDDGISDAFNKGIKAAKGEIIGIINADDWYELNACEIILEKFNNKVDIYFGSCQIWTLTKHCFTKNSEFKKLKKKMSIYHPTCFIRSECYAKHGMYNNKYKTTMDYDLLLRYKINGCVFLNVNKVIANFQLGGMSNLNKIKGAKETLEIKNTYLPSRKFANYVEFYIRNLKIILAKVFEK